MIYASPFAAALVAAAATISLTSAAPVPPLMARPTPPTYPITSSPSDGADNGNDLIGTYTALQAVPMGTRLYAADGRPMDLFGYSVAASTLSSSFGDAGGSALTSILAVGAPQSSLGAGSVHVSCVNAQLSGWVDDQLYGAPGSSHFGAAVYMPPKHASRLFVASKQFKGPIGPKLDSIALSAYAISEDCAFDLVDTVRLHTPYDTLLSLHASDSGSVVILGAPTFNSVSKPGAAFVYSRNNTDGSLEFVSALTAEPSTVGDALATTAPDAFGYSVAINDIFAAVGAPESDALTGAVHLYKCDITDRMWSVSLVLRPPFDAYGESSVKANGNRGTVSPRRALKPSDAKASQPESSESNQGREAEWTASSTHTDSSNTGSLSMQNASLASDGSNIPIYTDPVYSPSSGEYPSSETASSDLDVTTDGAPTYQDDDAKDAGTDGSSSAVAREPVYFGQSLALSHNLLYVGAPGWSSAAGRVFVYSLGLASDGDSVLASLHASIVPFDAAPNAMFGFSLSAVLGGIAVGAPGDHSSAGAVYLYELGGAVSKTTSSSQATWSEGAAVPGTEVGMHALGQVAATTAASASIAIDIAMMSRVQKDKAYTPAPNAYSVMETSGNPNSKSSAFYSGALSYALLNKYHGSYNTTSDSTAEPQAGALFGSSVALTPVLLLSGAEKASGPPGVPSGAAFATSIDLSSGYNAQPHTKYSVSGVFIIAAEVLIPSIALIFVATRAFKAVVKSRSGADDGDSMLRDNSSTSPAMGGNSDPEGGMYGDNAKIDSEAARGLNGDAAARNQFYSKYDSASSQGTPMSLSDLQGKSDIGSVANNWGILSWIKSRDSNSSGASLKSVSLDVSTRSTDALAPQSDRAQTLAPRNSMSFSASIAPTPAVHSTSGNKRSRASTPTAQTSAGGVVDADGLADEATPARGFLSLISPAVTFANSKWNATPTNSNNGGSSGANTPNNGGSASGSNTTSIAASHESNHSSSGGGGNELYTSPPGSPVSKHSHKDRHAVAV